MSEETTITVQYEDGREERRTFTEENIRIKYPDDSVIDPIVTQNLEYTSDRQKAEETTLCGKRYVSDDGEGKTTFTWEVYVDTETKDIIQQKQGVTGQFFNDISISNADSVFIKKATVGLTSEINTIIIFGKQYRAYDVQLQLEAE